MEIKIESEIIKGMAGEVKYHTKPCPYSVNGIGNLPNMVGSTQCQMCQHFDSITEASQCVLCNHG